MSEILPHNHITSISTGFGSKIIVSDYVDDDYVTKMHAKLGRIDNIVIDRTKPYPLETISQKLVGRIHIVNYPDMQELFDKTSELYYNILFYVDDIHNIKTNRFWVSFLNNTPDIKKVNISNSDMKSLHFDGDGEYDISISNCPDVYSIMCKNISNLKISGCKKNIIISANKICGLDTDSKVKLKLSGFVEILGQLQNVQSITISDCVMANMHADSLNVPHLIFGYVDEIIDLPTFNLSKVTKLTYEGPGIKFGDDQVLPKLISWTSSELACNMPECPKLRFINILTKSVFEECKQNILDNIKFYIGGLSCRSLKFKISNGNNYECSRQVSLDEIYNAVNDIQIKSTRTNI